MGYFDVRVDNVLPKEIYNRRNGYPHGFLATFKSISLIFNDGKIKHNIIRNNGIPWAIVETDSELTEKEVYELSTLGELFG